MIVKIVKWLRENNISSEMKLSTRSLKAQCKYADKINAKNVLVIGDDELKQKKFTIKNLSEGKQTEIGEEDLIKYFKG